MKYFLPLLVIACSVIGSLANIFINSDTWYVELVKSPLNPPSYVFGIVWPILYVLMAFVSFRSADKIWKLFIPQLIMNAAWSWMFFFMHAPLLALINISILIFLNQKILLILYEIKVPGIRAYKPKTSQDIAWRIEWTLKNESRLLFWLYLPYVLWLSFAAFLNASIVFLN